jgi:hypothetical protein
MFGDESPNNLLYFSPVAVKPYKVAETTEELEKYIIEKLAL